LRVWRLGFVEMIEAGSYVVGCAIEKED
jgi:hypothetical protein